MAYAAEKINAAGQEAAKAVRKDATDVAGKFLKEGREGANDSRRPDAPDTGK